MANDEHEIPAEAQRLHQEGRAAGGRGDHERALALFDQAQALAPGWPYPIYDAAFTYLLGGDTARAEELYEQVDRLAPRGFFTCKTSLDILRRERAGSLGPGFSKAWATLEWVGDPAEKRRILSGIVTTYPQLAPAWKELALLLDDRAERLAALDRGLACEPGPDPDTRGMLLLNKAMVLRQLGRADEAAAIIRDLAADPGESLVTEAWARKLAGDLG